MGSSGETDWWGDCHTVVSKREGEGGVGSLHDGKETREAQVGERPCAPARDAG